MSVKAVTYYTVDCDEPDCGATLGDYGDYSAWADSGSAIDDWTNDDGIVLDDGRSFCHNHAKGKRCDSCGEVEDLTEADGDFFCAECAKDEP
ncbi:MAG: hypothetical protein ACXVGA_00515 [Mycobacteriaceae bacterium]